MPPLNALLALACAALLVPADPAELTISHLHGGWLRALHGSRTSATVWIGGDGGVIRRSTGDGSTFVVEPTSKDVGSDVQIEGLMLVDAGALAGRGLAVGTGRTVLRRDPTSASWSRVDPASLPAPVAGEADERLTDVLVLDGGRKGELDVLLAWVVGEAGVLWHLREAYRDGELVEAIWARQDGHVVLPGTEPPFTRSLFSVHGVHEPADAPDATGPLHLYAGGDWGLLLHSTDGGARWTALAVPGRGRPGDDPATSFEIQDVVVGPDGRGAAVGGAWVRGKAGWVVGIERFTEVVPNTLGASGCAPAVACSTAWDVAWRGSVGYGVCALPDGRFLAVCYGSDTWRSPPRGARWFESTYVPLPSAERPLTPPLREVALAGPGDAPALYVVGHHGTVRRTLDPLADPVRWEQVLGAFVIRVTTGDFLDRQQGWIAGVSGPIVRTTDGGATYEVVCEAAGGSVMALEVVAQDSGVGVGYQPGRASNLRPYLAWLDGDGWHEHARGQIPGIERFDGEFTAVRAAGGRFWAAGSDGFVGFSDDGGARWSDKSLPDELAPARLEAVAALDRDTVVVAGHGGVAALHAVAGDGDAWMRLPVRATTEGGLVTDGLFTGDLLALAHDGTAGRTIAAGEGGYLFELDDERRAFVEIHRDEAGRDLTVVAVAPDGSLFVGGAGGAFSWHDAAGGTWQPAHSGTSTDLVAIVPVDAEAGFLVAGQSLLKGYTVTR